MFTGTVLRRSEEMPPDFAGVFKHCPITFVDGERFVTEHKLDVTNNRHTLALENNKKRSFLTCRKAS
jgi:hypothetical protein